MSLLTEQQFRALYVPKTAATVSSDQILEAFRKAETVVRKWVGDAAVADAKSDNPTNAPRADAIRSAHDALTRREMLDVRSTRFTDHGILHSTRSANGQAVNTMEDIEKVEVKRASLLAEAKEILASYLIAANASVVFRASSVSVRLSNEW